jgi:hypothetical protein
MYYAHTPKFNLYRQAPGQFVSSPEEEDVVATNFALVNLSHTDLMQHPIFAHAKVQPLYNLSMTPL